MTELPATCRSVIFRILDHKLNVRGGAGNERLRSAKNLVVFLGRGVTVVQSGDDCAVRERKVTLAVCFDREIVTQNGCKTIEVAFFMSNRDELPVAVPKGNLLEEDWRSLVRSLRICGAAVADYNGHRCSYKQGEKSPFEKSLFHLPNSLINYLRS